MTLKLPAGSRCSTCCVSAFTSRAPKKAAITGNAARVRYWPTDSASMPVSRSPEYHVATNADIPPIDVIFVDEDDLIVSRMGAKGGGRDRYRGRGGCAVQLDFSCHWSHGTLYTDDAGQGNAACAGRFIAGLRWRASLDGRRTWSSHSGFVVTWVIQDVGKGLCRSVSSAWSGSSKASISTRLEKWSSKPAASAACRSDSLP